MDSNEKTKRILALVGMSGAGKTVVANLLAKHGFPFVRFGDETDKGLEEKGLALTEENERHWRQQLRENLGMAAYAIKAKSRIEEMLRTYNVVVLDGLYSWEEYTFLKKEFPTLELICVFAEPQIRYERLVKRKIRPLSIREARQRDIDEIERLNKGGPIAIADYLLENNGTHEELKGKIDALLQQVGLP